MCAEDIVVKQAPEVPGISLQQRGIEIQRIVAKPGEQALAAILPD